MSKFHIWCDEKKETVLDHCLIVLKTDDNRAAVGTKAVARELPQHYVSADRYANILEKLGKPEAAKYLRNKLPETKSARSGDLGEILAISYIEEETLWKHTIKKLRWKDHRKMPMRGDDLIAIGFKDNEIQFLKGEAKSQDKLSKPVLEKAREMLSGDNERPTPHALAFFSDRLAEEGCEDIVNQIDDAQLRDGIPINRVSHMIFTFSGNNPECLLKSELSEYDGKVRQFSVGLQIETHQDFIKNVYDTVIADGNA